MATRDVTTAAASLEFDPASSVFENACYKIDTNHFINFFRGAQSYVQVFTVNTTTWVVTTAAALLQFDTSAGRYNACCQIDTNHFLNFRQGVSGNGFVQVFTVNTTTWAVTTAAASLEYDTVDSLSNSCFQIDANHFINFWAGSGSDGFVQVFTVNTTTWVVTTAAARVEFDTGNGTYNCCYKIDTNHFLNFRQGVSGDGFVQVFTVNTTTWAVTTTAARMEFDTANGAYHDCYQIDANHFINFWGGGAGIDDGQVQVFTVNTTTRAVTTSAARLQFDGNTGSFNSCYQVDTNHFINFRSGLDLDGYTQIFTVNTTTWVVTTAAASLEFDTKNNGHNACYKIDTNHFLNFRQGLDNDGYVQVFTVELPVDTMSRSETLDLSDSVTLVKTMVMSRTETLDLSDSYNDTAVHLISRSETIDLSDVVNRKLFYVQSETLDLSDAYLDDRAYVMARSETLDLSDSYLDDRSYVLSREETLDLSDVFARGLFTLISETLDISDAYSDDRAYVLSREETLDLSDLYDDTKATILTRSETLDLNDAVGRGLFVMISDTLDLSDTYAGIIAKVLEKSETLDLSDSVTLEIEGGDMVITETLNLSDEVRYQYYEIISETLDLSDLYTDDRSYVISRNETLDLSDVYADDRAYVMSRSETLDLSDALDDSKAMVMAKSETLDLSDLYTDLVDVNLTLQETLDISDVYSDAFSRPMIISETLDLSDAFLSSIDKLLSVSETLDLSDAVVLGKILTIIDTLDLSDDISLGHLQFLSITETLHLGEQVSGIGDPTVINGIVTNIRSRGTVESVRSTGSIQSIRTTGNISVVRSRGSVRNTRGSATVRKLNVI